MSPATSTANAGSRSPPAVRRRTCRGPATYQPPLRSATAATTAPTPVSAGICRSAPPNAETTAVPCVPVPNARGSRPPTNVREPLVAIVNAGASGPAANASGLEAISAAAAAEADHANAITTTHTSANAVLSDAQTLITEMISDGLE